LATPHALALGEFDGDGDVDIAVRSARRSPCGWFEKDGRGGFSPHDIETGHRQNDHDPNAVDLDGDGRIDLILAGRESRNVVVYFNRK
jgi:hypothetical protein